jgi:multidrug efflux pump
MAGAGPLHGGAGAVFERSLDGYRRSLDWALAHRRLVLLSFFATVAFNVHLYTAVPKGFMPEQDTGKVFGSLQADQGISFQAMRDKLTTLLDIIGRDPAVETSMGVVGGGNAAAGMVFVSLKPLAARELSRREVIARLRPQLAHEPGATLYLQPVQDVRAGGRAGNAQYQYTLRADASTNCAPGRRACWKRCAQLPRWPTSIPISRTSAEQTCAGRRPRRRRAARHHAAPDHETLNDLFGQRQVSTIYTPAQPVPRGAGGRAAVPAARASLEATASGAANGDADRAARVASVESTPTSAVVNHQGQFAATTIHLQPGAGRRRCPTPRATSPALAIARRCRPAWRVASRARPRCFRIRSPTSRC